MTQATPIPQGRYIPATRTGNMVFTAGMTPRSNGVLIKSGKIRLTDNREDYRDAFRQAASNALIAAQSMLHEGETIQQIMSISVYINTEEGFTAHAKYADYASEYFFEQLGSRGEGCRVSVGMSSLPGDAPCEISLICVIA